MNRLIRRTKTIKILATLASILLLAMGIFHGSGIYYINGLVQNSEVPQLVKNIFPVLFILPSLQLIGLGLIGLFAIQKPIHYPILLIVSILILIDAILAFWLKALIPGCILLIPFCIYLLAAWSSKNVNNKS